MTRIESVTDAFDPMLGSLGGFVIDGNVDGVEIDHFLETDGDNVGCGWIVGTPVGTEPGIEVFVFAFGVYVPCSELDSCLIILRKLLRPSPNLFTKPIILNLLNRFLIPSPPIFRLFILSPYRKSSNRLWHE